MKNWQRIPGKSESSERTAILPRKRPMRLDGEDAALWEEVTRVMTACGLCPESAGRRVQRAICEALRLESERSDAAIANVGDLAVKRWEEYQVAWSALFAPMGLTRFFAEGEWLRPGMWRYDRERLKEIRRGPW